MYLTNNKETVYNFMIYCEGEYAERIYYIGTRPNVFIKSNKKDITTYILQRFKIGIRYSSFKPYGNMKKEMRMYIINNKLKAI